MLAPGSETSVLMMNDEMQKLQSRQANMAKLAKENPEALEKAAKDFESFFIGHVFKEMYQAIPKSEVMGGTDAQGIFMGMYIDEVSKRTGTNPNGIAFQIMKQYKRHAESLEKTKSTIPPVTVIAPQNFATQEFNAKSLMNIHPGCTPEQNHSNVSADLVATIAQFSDKISSNYGNRIHPISKDWRFHEGLDVALPHGHEVLAPASGTVVFAGWREGYGHTVELDHGDGYSTLFAHLDKINVQHGENVSKNFNLGAVGQSGQATGSHLHFEVRKENKPINPMYLTNS